MGARLIRLIAFAAILLMPIGMAPAMSMPVPASAGHCDEHEAPADMPASAPDHCAACSALPGIDAPMPMAISLPTAPADLTAVTPFHGIEPDTITPPPKRS